MSPVVPSELGGASATNRYTRSLGVMEALGPPVVARIPSVVVPVCVFTSVEKCVLQRAHSVGERLCVKETTCVKETPSVSNMVCVSDMTSGSEKACVRETPCVSETPCMEKARCVKETACVSEMACVSERRGVKETPCVTETTCVRERYEREMTVGMRENATACPSVMEWCVSVVTRRCAWVEWRRRRRQRDKGRVAAVAVLGTAPGLHSSEREVRAVLHTSPPRARLRE